MNFMLPEDHPKVRLQKYDLSNLLATVSRIPADRQAFEFFMSTKKAHPVEQLGFRP